VCGTAPCTPTLGGRPAAGAATATRTEKGKQGVAATGHVVVTAPFLCKCSVTGALLLEPAAWVGQAGADLAARYAAVLPAALIQAANTRVAAVVRGRVAELAEGHATDLAAALIQAATGTGVAAVPRRQGAACQAVVAGGMVTGEAVVATGLAACGLVAAGQAAMAGEWGLAVPTS